MLPPDGTVTSKSRCFSPYRGNRHRQKKPVAEGSGVDNNMAATEDTPAVSHRNSGLCAVQQSCCFRHSCRRELCRHITEWPFPSRGTASAAHRRRFQTLSSGTRCLEVTADRAFHAVLPV